MNFSKNQNIFLSNAVGERISGHQQIWEADAQANDPWLVGSGDWHWAWLQLKCKPWNAKAGSDSQSPSTAAPECKGNQVLALRGLQGHSPAGKIKSGAICTTGRAQEGEF